MFSCLVLRRLETTFSTWKYMERSIVTYSQRATYLVSRTYTSWITEASYSDQQSPFSRSLLPPTNIVLCFLPVRESAHMWCSMCLFVSALFHSQLPPGSIVRHKWQLVSLAVNCGFTGKPGLASPWARVILLSLPPQCWGLKCAARSNVSTGFGGWTWMDLHACVAKTLSAELALQALFPYLNDCE